MALGAEALTARGVAVLGWQRRAQLLAPPTLDSLESPGWLGAGLDFGFPAPLNVGGESGSSPLWQPLAVS